MLGRAGSIDKQWALNITLHTQGELLTQWLRCPLATHQYQELHCNFSLTLCTRKRSLAVDADNLTYTHLSFLFSYLSTLPFQSLREPQGFPHHWRTVHSLKNFVVVVIHREIVDAFNDFTCMILDGFANIILDQVFKHFRRVLWKEFPGIHISRLKSHWLAFIWMNNNLAWESGFTEHNFWFKCYHYRLQKSICETLGIHLETQYFNVQTRTN